MAASPSASVPDRATTQLEQPKDTAAQENAPTSASSEHTAALDTDKDGKKKKKGGNEKLAIQTAETDDDPEPPASAGQSADQPSDGTPGAVAMGDVSFEV